jgi:tRNA pseudouridine65 synthase
MTKIQTSGEIAVLYQDNHLLAVYKPANLLMHKSPISSDKDFLLQRLHRQTQKHLYPIHRLDRATCGIVLFALQPETAAILSRDIQQHRMEKTYLAIVRGFVNDEGQIDYPLDDLKNHSTAMPRKNAITHYSCLARAQIPIPVRPFSQSRYSLVKIQPLTGRRHQIRRHFAHIRHPLIGDVNYGDGKHNAMFRSHFLCHRLLLAAIKISLIHPVTNKPFSIQTLPDDHFLGVIRQLFTEDSLNQLQVGRG